MKQHIRRALWPTLAFAALLLFLVSPGCKKDHNTTDDNNYQIVNLVADTAGFGASIIDPNLVNAWGVAVGPTGAFWISATEKGVTTIYDRNGATLLPAVSVPFHADAKGGEPTGVVYNSTTDFKIESMGTTSKFIYVDEHGVVSAWSSGTTTVPVADNSSDGAVYKGVAIAQDGGANFLYIANFSEGEIEVLDKAFQYITTKPFADPTIPAGFAPFNIKNIGGLLYVTYAKQKGPDNQDDEAGLGNGYVNIFKPDGTLVKRFASQGTLNSPWGIVQAPAGFNQGTNAILVGNFGDGFINVFDADGRYKGQLENNGSAISVEGLWSLTFPENGIPAGDQNQLFFTAGPDNEEHGVFGYIKIR
ncbi:MAG: TIGR03118 family protein [Saprospiraceae bacterium]